MISYETPYLHTISSLHNFTTPMASDRYVSSVMLGCLPILLNSSGAGWAGSNIPNALPLEEVLDWASFATLADVWDMSSLGDQLECLKPRVRQLIFRNPLRPITKLEILNHCMCILLSVGCHAQSVGRGVAKAALDLITRCAYTPTYLVLHVGRGIYLLPHACDCGSTSLWHDRIAYAHCTCKGPVSLRGWLQGCLPHRHGDPGLTDPPRLQASAGRHGSDDSPGLPMQETGITTGTTLALT